MKKNERVNFKIYPNDAQKEIIISNCHNERFAYNWGIAKIRDAIDRHECIPSAYSLAKEFNQFKKQPGYEWLIQKPASQRATKCAFVNSLKMAIRMFRRKHNGLPKYHTRKLARMSYYSHEGTTLYENNAIRLENLGWVNCKHNLPLDDPNVKIVNPVVIYTGDDFLVSVTLKYKTPVKPKYHYSDVDIHHQIIGIDIGVTHMAVTSDGDVYDCPNMEKFNKRISRLDRHLNKLYKSPKSYYSESIQTCDAKAKHPEYKYKSQNLLKLEAKRRKLYKKHVDIRKDYRCQTVAKIVKQYPEAIVIEDIKNAKESWKIPGAKSYNRRLNEIAVGDFIQRIKDKCTWLDIPLIIADSKYPSTQICNCCGNRYDNKLTKDRMFICSVCGYKEDRDLNAAINLRNFGYNEINTQRIYEIA